MIDTYEKSGVKTLDGDRVFYNFLSGIKKTFEFANVCLEFGYYANVIDIDGRLIALSTDGVGTKLLVAQLANKYDTVAIDCVAMNVNDIICVGATPVCLLDYIAVQKIDADIFSQLKEGFLTACRDAEVAIIGGETAQVKDMIRASVDGKGLDLVATAVGLVEGNLITTQDIKKDDVVIGLRSNGFHSNGYSLLRQIFFKENNYDLKWTPDGFSETLEDILLKPTKIYVQAIKRLFKEEIPIKGLFHITGDGMFNLLRTKKEVGFRLDGIEEIPKEFELVMKIGSIEIDKMFRIFNMGIGFCIVVEQKWVDRVVDLLSDFDAKIIGYCFGEKKRIVEIPAFDVTIEKG